MSIITTENIYQEVMSHSEFYSLMYPNFVKFYDILNFMSYKYFMPNF